MSTPWTDPNYPGLDFTKHKLYAGDHNQQPVLIKYSEILFAGSCDISGARESKYWHEIYCEESGLNSEDYVKIGHIGQPLNALVRKIYSYLKLVDRPPKKIFMVAPISCPEHILNSVAYPVPPDKETAKFLERIGIIPSAILPAVTGLINMNSDTYGPGQMSYEFCRNYSFLELMMRAYDIRLYWTPNLTRKAAEYYKNLDTYLSHHEYARNTFIGYDNSTVDFASDKLDFPSTESHLRLANLFLSIKNDK